MSNRLSRLVIPVDNLDRHYSARLLAPSAPNCGERTLPEGTRVWAGVGVDARAHVDAHLTYEVRVAHLPY